MKNGLILIFPKLDFVPRPFGPRGRRREAGRPGEAVKNAYREINIDNIYVKKCCGRHRNEMGYNTRS